MVEETARILAFGQTMLAFEAWIKRLLSIPPEEMYAYLDCLANRVTKL